MDSIVLELEEICAEGRISRLLDMKKHQEQLQILSMRMEDAKSSFAVSKACADFSLTSEH